MEQSRNVREWETGDSRENPATSGIVRHDPHLQKSGSEQANRSITAAPQVFGVEMQMEMPNKVETEMEKRQNATDGETGEHGENPPAKGNRLPTVYIMQSDLEKSIIEAVTGLSGPKGCSLQEIKKYVQRQNSPTNKNLNAVIQRAVKSFVARGLVSSRNGRPGYICEDCQAMHMPSTYKKCTETQEGFEEAKGSIEKKNGSNKKSVEEEEEV
ncbi:hypothetical protein PR048_010240 [Dryococelus australis]|uniref:H15 domain-containing protein n=1 Tax=Dryococelus australis TaxID=614101 RepID=A0ABQ9I269_9NEOP|nr:hypothetical protein PR048_010240 [Dryococelus australis]